MIAKRENVTETAQRIIGKRPVLEPIITAFEELFKARAELPKDLVPLVEKSGLCLPKLSEEYASQGRSLLSGMSLKGFDPVIAACAKAMLPLLAKQEYLKPFIPNLETYFLAEHRCSSEESNAEKALPQTYVLAEAYIANDSSTIEQAAKALEVPSEALFFTFHYILAPALHALVLKSIPAVAQLTEPEADLDGESDNKKPIAPWDANALWKEGYCPVCVSFPSISYLDRALLDENNQFLSSGGGKKYLHCSLCGSNWHFKRGACPACKAEGPDVMEIIKESSGEGGERIDFCTKCNSYCPNVDLRVSGKRPDFDMMALGMMHLDMIAAEKKLVPLVPSFWNTTPEKA